MQQRLLVEQRASAIASDAWKKRHSRRPVGRRQLPSQKQRICGVSVLVLTANWVLVSAAIGSIALAASQASGPAPQKLPEIVLVKPDVQQKGYPITIEIRDLPASPTGPPEFTVTIGGEPAKVTPVSVPETGDALITAVVPSTLSNTDLHPLIYVSFRGYLLRYEGNFSIQQEMLAEVDQGRVAAFLQGLRRLPDWLFVVAGVGLLVVVTATLFGFFEGGFFEGLDNITTRWWKRRLIDKAL